MTDKLKYQGMDEFREKLSALGWRIAPQHRQPLNRCDWYAWNADREGITPDCVCNKKPPSLIVYPSEIDLGGNLHASVEVEICGEVSSGEWLKLRAYSIKLEEFFDRFKTIRARLVAAWKAGAASP